MIYLMLWILLVIFCARLFRYASGGCDFCGAETPDLCICEGCKIKKGESS